MQFIYGFRNKDPDILFREPVESPIFQSRLFFYEGSNSFVGQMNRRINNQPLNLGRAVNWGPLNTGYKQGPEAVCWQQETGGFPTPEQLVPTNKRPAGRFEWPIPTPGSLNGSTLTGKSHHPLRGWVLLCTYQNYCSLSLKTNTLNDSAAQSAGPLAVIHFCSRLNLDCALHVLRGCCICICRREFDGKHREILERTA